MTKAIDFNKPLFTTDGRPVRVVCTDAKGSYPVLALITEGDGTEDEVRYNLEGKYWNDGDFDSRDLVNREPQTEEFVNYYGAAKFQSTFDTLSAANRAAAFDREAVFRIVKEGQKVVSVELVNAS